MNMTAKVIVDVSAILILNLKITPRRPGEVHPSTEVAHLPIGHFPAHDDGFGTHISAARTGKSRIKCLKCKVHILKGIRSQHRISRDLATGIESDEPLEHMIAESYTIPTTFKKKLLKEGPMEVCFLKKLIYYLTSRSIKCVCLLTLCNPFNGTEENKSPEIQSFIEIELSKSTSFIKVKNDLNIILSLKFLFQRMSKLS
ncbi:unnamed protein product [Leptidea sinapis]|uniref:Uncharacterized protein n=1 Tax=Leptidea sinapis TaxID=189913 RepID=A0A5E4PR78_9NEOP|nr:unnamed protein product [Leptidea sinapis]